MAKINSEKNAILEMNVKNLTEKIELLESSWNDCSTWSHCWPTADPSSNNSNEWPDDRQPSKGQNVPIGNIKQILDEILT